MSNYLFKHKYKKQILTVVVRNLPVTVVTVVAVAAVAAAAVVAVAVAVAAAVAVLVLKSATTTLRDATVLKIFHPFDLELFWTKVNLKS